MAHVRFLAVLGLVALPQTAPATCPAPEPPGVRVSIYQDELDNCFEEQINWGGHDLAHLGLVHSGSTSIEFTPHEWSILKLGRAGLRSRYNALEFWLHGGATGGQVFAVEIVSGRDRVAWDVDIETLLGRPIPAGTWTKVTVPFRMSTAADDVIISFKAYDGAYAPLYLDDIALLAETAGTCTGAQGDPCPDGNVCNGTELCDGAGTCVRGVPLPLDDLNPCTIDTCDPVAGVRYEYAAAGLSCFVDGVCNAFGACDGAGHCLPSTSVHDVRVYDDAVAACFEDASTGTSYDPNQLTIVHGGAHAIRFEPRGFEEVVFRTDDLGSSFDSLEFWIHGGSVGGQAIQVLVEDGLQLLYSGWVDEVLGHAVAPGTWERVTVPLTASSIPGRHCVHFVAWDSADELYLDDIRFVASGSDLDPPAVTLESPPDGSAFNQHEVYLNITYNDALTGVDLSSVRVMLDGVDCTAALTIGSGAAVGTLSVGEGPHTLHVAVSDHAGNVAARDAAFIIDVTPPVLAVSGVASVSRSSVSPSVTFTDTGSGVAAATFHATLDGADVTDSFAVDASSAFGAFAVTGGPHTLQTRVSDRAGNVAVQDTHFVVDLAPPILAVVAPSDGSTSNPSSISATITYADALSGVSPSTLSISLDGQDVTNTFAVGPVSASAVLAVGAGTHQLDVQIADLAANVAYAHSSFTATSANPLPPDPIAIAPPNNPNTITDIATSTSFLYNGGAPIQNGVAPNTIDPSRVTIIRGHVKGRDGSPISGVHITILGHVEFGTTLTRADGAFDIAVNGGGLVTVNYQKDGFLPAQRQVQASSGDYVRAQDVVLVPFDTNVATITLGSSVIQMARGASVADADGTRQATLLFPTGTNASIVMPDGTTRPLAAMHVRATEYTVGPDGQKAMPAALPPASGYTYAVELSVDEAVMAGATRVQFDRPVAFYVENFLGFPVGGMVPAGYYDATRGVWVPSDNGRVVKIVGVSGSLADLDVDGSGAAADPAALASLGIADDERARVAATYAPGTSMWRVPMTHFSPWDLNWPYGCAGGPASCPPPSPPAPPPPPPDCSSSAKGSIIECEAQVLGERVPVSGTNFALHYSSRRSHGYATQRRSVVPLVGNAYASNLDSIELTVDVAGQHHQYSFRPSPNLAYTFEWDGKDAYGRDVIGTATASIRIAYLYPATYLEPSALQASFAAFSASGIAATRSRTYVVVPISYSVVLHAERAPSPVAGWSVNIHHSYDGAGRRLLLGDGTARSAAEMVVPIAGTGTSGYSGDGGPATAAFLNGPAAIAVGPDGALFIADCNNNVVRRVGRDGIITTVAGTGVEGLNGEGDGGPATAAPLACPMGVAVGRDGALLIAAGDNRVRRVGPDGIISTFAGTGVYDYVGDGGPATAAAFRYPSALAFGPDGTLFIADEWNSKIRRVGTDGIITTAAGLVTDNFYGYGGDGGPAAAALLAAPEGVAVGPDAALYIADHWNHRIRRVGPDGMITTVAGLGNYPHNGPTSGSWYGDYTGDGGPATAAQLNFPSGIAFGSDGALYIADTFNDRIRRVGPDGIITTVAGKGTYTCPDPVQSGAGCFTPIAVAMGADGLFVATADERIVSIRPAFPGLGAGDFWIASESARELFVFNSSGRHLRTLDARTNVALHSFGYDSAGRLESITDRDGLVTIIERSSGVPTAIVAPHGQRTTLSVDGNAYLSAITSPAGETHSYTYDANGLMRSYTDPRGGRHAFEYDPSGRLTFDADAGGGSKTLGRTDRSDGFSVSLTTALGRTTFHDISRLLSGDLVRTVARPDGSVSTRTEFTSSGNMSTTAADGTRMSATLRRDPRFGMQAPVASTTTRTPSGISLSTIGSRTATLADPLDPLSATLLSETRNVNGRLYSTTYSAATRTTISTTPAGRTTGSILDDRGRLSQLQATGVLPASFGYDAMGRLSTVTQGARTYSFGYDAQGYLNSITDPLLRVVSFTNDSVGRVLMEMLPGDRTVSFSYDRNGNMVSLSPPGRPTHEFTFTPADHEASYSPPYASNAGLLVTTYGYDLDGGLLSVLLPDQSTIVRGYDGAGRLTSIASARGGTLLSYDTAGRVATVTAPDGGTLTYGYDGFLATSETSAGIVAGSIAWTYDNDFRVSTTSVNGSGVSHSYDPDGLLAGAGALTTAREPATGRVSGTTLGTVVTSQSYDASYGQLAGFTASAGANSLYSYSLTRDLAGRITGKTETVQGTTNTYVYGYDDSGRLATVTRDGQMTANYVYDANGNRLLGTNSSGSATGTYDAQDRMMAYGAATYTYGPSGDLQTRTAGGQTTTYSYDALGNLMGAWLPDGRVIEYVVDGLNRRVGKKVNGTLVEGFLYDGQLRPVAWLNGAGQVYATFVYGTRVNVPEYMVVGGVSYRIVTDHLGSPRLVVNAATGGIAQGRDYDAWGNVLLDTNPGFQPFGFAGGLYDGDTGLVRFGARDYDPQSGRWTNKDPIRFRAGDPNVYVYVANDPVNWKDPTGLWTLQVGLTLDITFPNGFSLTGYAGFALDGQGTFGTYWGGGAGTGVGAGMNGGVQVLGSNASCIGALAGPGINIGAGGGWGPSAAADAFFGPSSSPGGPPILGGGLTFGAGYGVTSFFGPVVTAISPIGSVW